jgi:hypothetical protein
LSTYDRRTYSRKLCHELKNQAKYQLSQASDGAVEMSEGNRCATSKYLEAWATISCARIKIMDLRNPEEIETEM